MTDAPRGLPCRPTASTCRCPHRSGSIDVVTVRKGLTAVTKPSRETAWRGPTRFAARIQETLVLLHELVAARHPGCVSLDRARDPLRRQVARRVQRRRSRHGCPARGRARSAPGRLPCRAAQARGARSPAGRARRAHRARLDAGCSGALSRRARRQRAGRARHDPDAQARCYAAGLARRALAHRPDACGR